MHGYKYVLLCQKIHLRDDVTRLFTLCFNFLLAPESPSRVFFEFFRKISKKFVTQGAPPVSTTLAENGKKCTAKVF
jgi:hypothetical protein